jgi:hypothetical protein
LKAKPEAIHTKGPRIMANFGHYTNYNEKGKDSKSVHCPKTGTDGRNMSILLSRKKRKWRRMTKQEEEDEEESRD